MFGFIDTGTALSSPDVGAADLFGDASDISDDDGDAEAAAPAKRAASDDEDDVRRGSDYEDDDQDQDQPRAVIEVRDAAIATGSAGGQVPEDGPQDIVTLMPDDCADACPKMKYIHLMQ